MLANILSSNRPDGPWNGRPARSSSAPGTSPTTTSPAAGLPSANTSFVAVAASGQAVKVASAWRSASMVLAPPATVWA